MLYINSLIRIVIHIETKRIMYYFLQIILKTMITH